MLGGLVVEDFDNVTVFQDYHSLRLIGAPCHPHGFRIHIALAPPGQKATRNKEIREE